MIYKFLHLIMFWCAKYLYPNVSLISGDSGYIVAIVMSKELFNVSDNNDKVTCFLNDRRVK